MKAEITISPISNKYRSLLEGWSIRDHISTRFSFSEMLLEYASSFSPNWDEDWYGYRWRPYTYFKGPWTRGGYSYHRMHGVGVNDCHRPSAWSGNLRTTIDTRSRNRCKTTTLPRSRACPPSRFLWLLPSPCEKPSLRKWTLLQTSPWSSRSAGAVDAVCWVVAPR